MSTLHHVRRVTLLSLPALALVLSACGGTGPQPGTAVAIDGHRLSVRHVDDVAARYCAALTKVGTGGAVPAQAVRTEVVSALTARLAAEAFAAERGIEPNSSYEQALAQLRPQLASFDEKTQAAITEVQGAQPYIGAVVAGVGEQSFTEWLGKQDVRVNPVYGVRLDGDKLARVDPSLSVAASDLAKSADKAVRDPSAADAGSLPSSQRCGGGAAAGAGG